MPFHIIVLPLISRYDKLTNGRAVSYNQVPRINTPRIIEKNGL